MCLHGAFVSMKGGSESSTRVVRFVRSACCVLVLWMLYVDLKVALDKSLSDLQNSYSPLTSATGTYIPLTMFVITVFF